MTIEVWKDGHKRIIDCNDERQEIAIHEAGEVTTFYLPENYRKVKRLIIIASRALYAAA